MIGFIRVLPLFPVLSSSASLYDPSTGCFRAQARQAGAPLMRVALHPVVLAFLALVAWCGHSAQAQDGFGPLYDHFPLTLADGTRTEWLGPLVSHEAQSTDETWAISPLWSYKRDKLTDF